MSRHASPRVRALARPRSLTHRALIAGAVLAAVAATAPPASAKPFTASGDKVIVGVAGGRTVHGYARAAGRKPAVFQFFVAWGDRFHYAYRRAGDARAGLMLHLSTYNGPGTVERITPRAIALGRGDRYLLTLRRDLARYRHPVYLRLFSEMNNAANPYSAYHHNGRRRDRSHATSWFRQAWRRTVLVLKGRRVGRIDARLRALGLPRLRRGSRLVAARLPDPHRRARAARAHRRLPHTRIAVQWVPMTAGSPDVPGNRPGAYWPGAAFVDWVGTDFYSKFPNFRGLDRFYATPRYRGKPFVFGEWAMWGRDDARFMRRFFSWVRDHGRVRMLSYYQGNHTGSVFRLYRYPRAAGVMRRALRAPRYTGRIRPAPRTARRGSDRALRV
jgi:hypothetical protein